jgi:hypothetical protein
MTMSAQTRPVVHPDIKPENPPERSSHYVDAPNMPWEGTKFPGIRIKVLYSDDSGITTALFKLDPGAVVPLHEHVALEQTYVIRATAAAFCFHVGTAAGGFVPPVLTYFAIERHMGFAVPMLVGTVGGLVSFVITLFLSPETKGKVLLADLELAPSI